ncbi:lariat debranching enzyme, C-terminal domain-containing protein [Amylocarpus encephaloides]|uniref:Lariat debranching enzyme, C-terminal domain-containing protein n=1 Tax=Amylocarpus encephaloides TaxID=45428 RepID=A0A9P8CBH2_9HELO|nr:lariat debranching enzyme, C-terminal domain-containing protein [Amylocarpus encephaloides]
MGDILSETQGLRIAVEGCGHGTLDAIYASIEKACEVRGWDGVDLLIIGGDFQAVRNASDLTVMSCPVKYRAIGDFHKYYSGSSKAPYLTIFVGGNHEASSHLWELSYGGWVAPNIYYMGTANVVRLGGVRISGMSGIWKGFDFKKHHHERLPYNADDVKSIYHVRELDIRKLCQLRSQVDIGISHDWPRAIEKHGNQISLFKAKPHFEQESKDGTLGSLAASYVMDRLRPPYWFAAHMHCKFSATKIYQDKGSGSAELASPSNVPVQAAPAEESSGAANAQNSEEIDLDMDADNSPQKSTTNIPSPVVNEDEIDLDDDAEPTASLPQASSSVPLDIRAQLPSSFARPTPLPQTTLTQKFRMGQPSPPEVTNKTVRFLALDKCLPGRKFLQLLEVTPHSVQQETNSVEEATPRSKPKFQYDPEWLAITRVFAPDLVLGDRTAPLLRDLGELHYRPLIEKELDWVSEHVEKLGKLEIPENFVVTAPVFEEWMPEIINDGPLEYSNPQMQQFCELVGIENKFHAPAEERDERMRRGAAAAEVRRGGFGRGGGRRRGRGRGGRW